MNPYTKINYLIAAGAAMCAECKERGCLKTDDPYCEKLQKAFREVVRVKP